MAANPIVNLITQGARARGLDPAAVLAVASQEGLSGRPGDQGSSFGPFQLHIGGAFPTGQVPRGQEQAWAMSPAGINYALDRIAGVAKGLRGPQAVSAIVSRFERPANPSREIAGANAAYGNYGAIPAGLPSPSPSLPVPAPAGAPAVPAPRGLSSALAMAVNTGNQMFGLPPLPAQLLSPVAPQAAPTLAPPAARTLPIPPGPGGGQGAAAKGGLAFPIGIRGPIIGKPYQGTHTMYGNWESDNAVDIAAPKGTPIYATANGTIGSQFGALGGHDPHLEGLRLHLVTNGNEFYYAHLSQAVVRPGQTVKKGQLLGYSGVANGVAHLHIASKAGNPLTYFGGR